MSNFMKFTVPMIADAIKSLGYKVKEIYEESYSLIESSANGRSFVLIPLIAENELVSSADAEALCVRFRAIWYGMDCIEEAQVDSLCNWFNSSQPFTKLFRKSTESSFNIILEADLYVLDGMSVPAFQNRIEAFISSYEFAMKSLDRCTYVDKAAMLERHDKAIEMLHSDCDDTSEAVHAYRTNSHLGFAGSQNNFGDLFETGDLVPKDDLLAMYWYTRASERGEPTAYYSLATLLEKSRDNPDSLVLAAQYAILACIHLPEGRNKAAAFEVNKALKEEMSAELYALSESYAADFKPIYEEKWTLSDSPGPKVTVVPGSDLLN